VLQHSCAGAATFFTSGPLLLMLVDAIATTFFTGVPLSLMFMSQMLLLSHCLHSPLMLADAVFKKVFTR